MADLTFLPDYGIEAMGAAVLSPRLTGIGRSVDFLYFEDPNDPRIDRLRQILQRNGFDLAGKIDGSSGRAVFMPPGLRLGRKQWAALGVAEYRMRSQEFNFDLSDAGTLKRLQDNAFAQLGISVESIAPRRIGANRYRQEVMEGVLGRSIIQNGQFHGEWEPGSNGQRKGSINPDSFFRGTTPEGFAGSARGVAMMIANGEQMDARRMSVLYQDVIAGAPHIGGAIGFREIDFAEEIELSLASLVTPIVRRSNQPWALGRRFDTNLAAHTERTAMRMKLQQYSTPFPIARAAFEVLVPQDNERVLEPTVGNGTLVSSFVGRNVSVNGIELDAKRAQRASRLGPNVDILEGNFLEQAASLDANFDLLVANPPFEPLSQNLVVKDRLGSQMTLRRLDHQIAYEALQKIDKDKGRAFLVLPADMMKHGALKGANRYWDNYLRQNYHVAGAACVDGRLYRKMGASFPVLLYALGPMRDRPLTADEVREVEVEELPLLIDHDAIEAWAAQTRAAMLELTNFPDQEPGYYSQPAEDRKPAPTPRPTDAEPSGENRAPDQSESDGAENSAPSRRSGARKAAPGRSRSRAENGAAEEAPNTPAPVAPAEPESPAEDEAEAPEPPKTVSAATTLVDDTEDDVFVRNYEPFSNVGQAKTKIQKSLQGLTYRALMDVQSRHGDIDDFVAEKLGLKVDQLADRFSPEQIDAAALAFARKAEGRGIMFADLMGVGKGRELAMMALAAYAEDRPVIFWSEQPNLFTDFVARDIRDVFGSSAKDMRASEAIRPFIFNQTADAIIKDEDGTVLYRCGDVKTARDAGIDPDINLVCSTYSQVQTPQGAWKTDAIINWARSHARMGKAPELILDEVHKAAGETSATSFQLEKLVDAITAMGGTVTYSSATPLKSGKNIRIYKPILPDTGMDVEALTQLIESNPLALQEVLSSEMARMGTMISREVDNSGVIRHFVSLEEIDPEKHARIVKDVDKAAHFLRELVEKAEEIDRAATLRSSAFAGAGGGGAKNKVSVQTTSPVAQFHTFSQYLMIAVKSAFDEELIIDAIAAGRKPVVVVENTAKEVLNRLAARVASNTPSAASDERRIDRLPNIGDVLIENASKLLDVKFTDPTGNKTEMRLEDEFGPWLREFTEDVEDADLSGLILNPIDKLKLLAEKYDLEMGEITKRNLEAEPLEDGGFEVVSRRPADKREVIRDFNNGDLDFIVMNRSAASGVSMHASPSVGVDLRPRRMIKLQLQSEITSERQIDGRIQRYGQIHDGEYTIPMSGFAADDRLCQLFNRKNRSLTATSNATRENRTNIDDAADLMNPVGEGAVRQYLIENPHIAVALGLPNPSGTEGANIDSYARRLMGRLVCLSIAQQETVLSEVDTIFRMHVEALDARGLNPLRLNQHDWKAEIEHVSTLLVGDDSSDQVGKRSLNLVKLRYSQTVEPFSFDQLEKHIDRGHTELVDTEMGRYVSPREYVGSLFDPSGEPSWSDPAYDNILNRSGRYKSLGLDEISVDEARAVWQKRYDIDYSKATATEKRVLRAISYAEFLDKNVSLLEPGNFLQFDTKLFPQLAHTRLAIRMAQDLDREVRRVPATITRVRFKEEDFLNLGAWKIDLAVPGETHVETVTLSGPYGILADMDEEERKASFSHASGFVEPLASLHGSFIDTCPPDEVVFSEPSRPFCYNDQHSDHLAKVSLPRQFKNPASVEESCRERSFANKDFREFMRFAYDDAPAGKVATTRYALDGNMFQAVKIAQSGKSKLGEKAIFTTASGEIRHGVILKNESIDKLRATLENSVAGLSQPFENPKPRMVEAFLSVHDKALQFDRFCMAYKRHGQVTPSMDRERVAMEKLVEDIALLLSNGVGGEGFTEYVDNNLAGIIDDLRRAMKTNTISEVYIGSDTFMESGSEIHSVSVGEWPCVMETHRSYVNLDSSKFDARAFAAHAKLIAGNDVHLVHIGDAQPASHILAFNKKSDVIAETEGGRFLNVLENSTDRLYTGKGGKLTKGVVTQLFSNEPKNGKPVPFNVLGKLLCEVADKTDCKIMMRGSIAGAYKALDKHRAPAFEFVSEKNLQSENKSQMAI